MLSVLEPGLLSVLAPGRPGGLCIAFAVEAAFDLPPGE